jgi:hypothetical protein
MKRSKPCLPRKLKKAMDTLLISNDGEVFTKVSYRLRRYPRTKWVVRAERQFRRKWLECKRKDELLKALRFSTYEKEE